MMIKFIKYFFIIFIPFMAIANEVSINSISDAFANGKVDGLIRYGMQNRDSNYHITQDAPTDTSLNDIQAYSSLGGYIRYETAPLYNISFGTTIYTSNPLGSNPSDEKGLGGLYEANGKQESYSVIGEAFIKLKTDEHLVKIGKQELPNYRFVSLSDIRMTPLTYRGAIYENSSINDLKLNLAYLTSQKGRNSTDFQDMVRAARISTGCGELNSHGECVKSGEKRLLRGEYDPNHYNSSGNYIGEDKDMPLIGAIYTKSNFKIEAWNYYVNDFINTIYFYGDYTFNIIDNWKLLASGQYAHQDSIGDSVGGDVDTGFYGLKLQANLEDKISLFTAYNKVDYNENSFDGGSIFVRWGTPQLFNSFQVQDGNLAGTKSIGAGVQFDLGALDIIDSTVIRFRHAFYNMPDDLYKIDARQDRTESTFDVRYSFTKKYGFGIFTQLDGLSLQFRMAYNEFETDYNIEKYKLLHGYNAFSVTDNFLDMRVTIDYRF
ncbi:MAG: OprD family outer membrane porin [Sulfurovum sp.]|nr:OprD family outer membrane porin [Sulfurovaceae bacterium]